MKHILTLTFFQCLFLTITAQHHDNNWIFGYGNISNYDSTAQHGGVRLHFDSGYPEGVRENIRFSYDAYCAVCSDSSGLLAFHTNGREIRNRLHAIMENGDTINPGTGYNDYPDGYPSISGGTAIPAPGFEDSYYLFHTSINDDLGSEIDFPVFYFTLIDMKANGGLGEVVSKNNVLAEGNIPQPTLVKHGNGRDWWLFLLDYVGRNIQFYLIDPDGIQLVHVVDSLDAFFDNAYGYPYVRFSNNGNFLGINDDHAGLWLFDFDRCTGTINNLRILPYAYPFYTSSIEFSADDRFLYLGTHLVIYQVDMQTIDDAPYVAIDTIARYEYGGSPDTWVNNTHILLPQIGPDKKIYYNTFGFTQTYHVMNQPDFPVLASDFQQRGLAIPRYRDFTWCYFPNYRLGCWSGSPCDTVSALSPPNSEFNNTVYKQPKEPTDFSKPKVLQLPPWFKIPPAEEQEGELPENYPLNIKNFNQMIRAPKE